VDTKGSTAPEERNEVLEGSRAQAGASSMILCERATGRVV